MSPQTGLLAVIGIILLIACVASLWTLRKEPPLPSLSDKAKSDLDSTERQFMTALARQEETDAEIAMLSARMTRLRSFIDADTAVQVAPGLTNISEFKEQRAA